MTLKSCKLLDVKCTDDLHQIWFGKQTRLSASIDQTGKNHHHSKSTNIHHMECQTSDDKLARNLCIWYKHQRPITSYEKMGCTKNAHNVYRTPHPTPFGCKSNNQLPDSTIQL